MPSRLSFVISFPLVDLSLQSPQVFAGHIAKVNSQQLRITFQVKVSVAYLKGPKVHSLQEKKNPEINC